MHQIETELKWAVSAEGHGILARELPGLLGAGRLLLQDNRFFDTADRRLRQALMNLRLRREQDRLVMTCKRRLPGDGPGLARHDEWEREIPLDLLDADPTGPGWLERLPLPEPVRLVLADQSVQALGGFRNERWEFHRASEVVCLDATTFPGRTDHELEVETGEVEATTAFWRERLAAWGVAWTPQPTTKFARFLASGGV